jgi:hypothetical protein
MFDLRNYRYDPTVEPQQEGNIKMLYITPEKFSKSGAIRNLLNQLSSRGLISRFVIDEAHCLSQVIASVLIVLVTDCITCNDHVIRCFLLLCSLVGP